MQRALRMSSMLSLPKRQLSRKRAVAMHSTSVLRRQSNFTEGSGLRGSTRRICTSSVRVPLQRCSAALPGSGSSSHNSWDSVLVWFQRSEGSCMKLGFTKEQEHFRAAAATWLEEQLSGAFADLRGVNGHAEMPMRRKEWERVLGRSNWSCVGWPKHFGGRAATLAEQVIFAEEYARAGGPNRIGHLGVELVGPTLLALGTVEQQRRFLPPIARGEEIWCQGYSEPNAGSDLANVRTSARIEHGPNGPEWVIDGQKIWTSLA